MTAETLVSPKIRDLFEAARSLGGRHTLHVIGYKQERFLIAASPGGVIAREDACTRPVMFV